MAKASGGGEPTPARPIPTLLQAGRPKPMPTPAPPQAQPAGQLAAPAPLPHHRHTHLGRRGSLPGRGGRACSSGQVDEAASAPPGPAGLQQGLHLWGRCQVKGGAAGLQGGVRAGWREGARRAQQRDGAGTGAQMGQQGWGWGAQRVGRRTRGVGRGGASAVARWRGAVPFTRHQAQAQQPGRAGAMQPPATWPRIICVIRRGVCPMASAAHMHTRTCVCCCCGGGTHLVQGVLVGTRRQQRLHHAHVALLRGHVQGRGGSPALQSRQRRRAWAPAQARARAQARGGGWGEGGGVGWDGVGWHGRVGMVIEGWASQGPRHRGPALASHVVAG